MSVARASDTHAGDASFGTYAMTREQHVSPLTAL